MKAFIFAILVLAVIEWLGKIAWLLQGKAPARTLPGVAFDVIGLTILLLWGIGVVS